MTVPFGIILTICDLYPAVDFTPEFLIIDRNIECVEPIDDFLHQRPQLIVVKVVDIIPRNLAPVGIDDADIRLGVWSQHVMVWLNDKGIGL